MSKQIVYRYVLMNADNHKDVPGANMATAAAIRRMNAHIDLASATEVDDSEVDQDGICAARTAPLSVEKEI